MTPDFPNHRYELSEPVELGFRCGDKTLPVSVRHMDVTERIALFGAMSVESFLAAIQCDAFHLAGESALPAWDSQKELEVALALDPGVAQSYANTDDIFSSLFQVDSPLRDAGAWYALEAMQREALPWDPDETVEIGIRTRWAEGTG